MLTCSLPKTCSTAVIIATGPTDRLNPFGSYQTDFEGNKNLVAAAKQEVRPESSDTDFCTTRLPVQRCQCGGRAAVFHNV